MTLASQIPPEKFRILLICTGNSSRSQIGEGLVRHFMGDRVDVESAGVLPSYVHPVAIAVLNEIGIDTSGMRSKHVDEFAGEDFDLVVTLCSYAKETCGIFPWAHEQVHMGFDDPIGTIGTNEEILEAFRNTREEIRKKLLPFIEERYESWRINKTRGV